VVLGVSFDSPKKNRAFAKKFDFPYLLLSDEDRAIGMAYHAASDPDQGSADRITYVIGEDGLIEQAYETVDTRSHPAEILASL